MNAVLQWVLPVLVLAAIFAVPLVLRRKARTSYASAARVVLATYPILLAWSAFGTAIVAPVVWHEQLRMAASFAALAAVFYALWCLLVVRRNRRRM